MKTSIHHTLRRSVAGALLALGLAGAPIAADARTDAPQPRGSALASSEEVERAAIQQYADLKRQAAAQGALAPPEYPPLRRVRQIAQRLIEQAPRYNPRASQWQWEVNLIGSKQVNAFCMPGGKIAVYTGLLDRLKLTDDEVAVVVGHEIAHALLEHGRERVGKTRAAQWITLGASVFSQVLGYGNLGGQVANTGGQLLLLKYGRADETEADEMGLELAARAGYDPRAAVVLWQKMDAVNRNQQQPPQWLSTHPSNTSRVRDIQARLPQVLPLYAKARGTRPDDLPPYGSAAARAANAADAATPGPRGLAPAHGDVGPGVRGMSPRAQ